MAPGATAAKRPDFRSGKAGPFERESWAHPSSNLRQSNGPAPSPMASPPDVKWCSSFEVLPLDDEKPVRPMSQSGTAELVLHQGESMAAGRKADAKDWKAGMERVQESWELLRGGGSRDRLEADLAGEPWVGRSDSCKGFLDSTKELHCGIEKFSAAVVMNRDVVSDSE